MIKTRHLLLFSFLILLSGCSREGPDDPGGIDPAPIEVEIGLTLSPAWENYESRWGSEARSGVDPRRRFVVEIRQRGELVLRRSVAPDGLTAGQTEIILPETFLLQPREYTLAVWSDYTKAGSVDDLYYDTSDFQRIAIRQPYTAHSDWRDCFYAAASFNLRPHGGRQQGAPVRVTARMTRPVARYQIVATDVEEFLAIAPKVFPGQTEFGIRFVYSFFVPIAFNVWEGKPTDSRTDVAFERTVSLSEIGGGEFLLGSDHLFMTGTGSHIPLTVEIFSLRNGNVLGRLPDLDVPYRRDAVTTLRGRFFGALFGSGSGVNIDSDFKPDDIDIDLGRF